jgi:hypothetical protein
MSTIDELMEGKKPGEIKVTKLGWNKENYFRPFFRDEQGEWHGLDELEHKDTSDGYDLNDNWSLWVEPKPKVVLHEVLVPELIGYSLRLYEEENIVNKKAVRTGRTFEVDG